MRPRRRGAPGYLETLRVQADGARYLLERARLRAHDPLTISSLTEKLIAAEQRLAAEERRLLEPGTKLLY